MIFKSDGGLDFWSGVHTSRIGIVFGVHAGRMKSFVWGPYTSGVVINIILENVLPVTPSM